MSARTDPTLADGLAGMKSFATEIAGSPTADITIHRTLVDGNFVLLHSGYQGVGRYGGPAVAFDLFRFDGDKIVEHWDVLTAIPVRDQWKNSNGPF